MVYDWRELTDYHACACCGQPLAGFVQVIGEKQRVYVTCENPECHPDVTGQTMRPHIHAALCYAIYHQELALSK